jgi:vacuolar-type H+-ATPase subunit I/STV1
LNEPIITPPVTPPPSVTSKKQSGIGIASFVISILGVLIFCVAMLISVGYGVSLASSNPLAGQNPYAAIDRGTPVMIVAIILSWCGPLLNLVGVGLGIAAVLQKSEKKTFGIVGLVISGLVVISFCLLTILGTIGQLSSY